MIAASEALTSSVASATCSKTRAVDEHDVEARLRRGEQRRRRFRAGRARHPPLLRRTRPEDSDRAVERAGLDAIRQRLLSGQYLLQAAVRRDTGQEPGGQVSIARIGVHDEHPGAAFGDGKSQVGNDHALADVREGRDENQRQSRAPFGADPFDGSGRETERFGDGGVRVGGHRQAARGRPIRPQRLLCLEGRDLADQRHTVECLGILPVNEALAGE